MAKKKKSQFEEYWSYMESSVIESEAWIQLPPAAAKILNVLRLIAYGPLEKSTKKDIKVGLMTLARRTGQSKQTVRNQIIRLVNDGFLDYIDRGGLKGLGKDANVYRLSWRFYDFGKANFKKGTLQKESRPAVGFIKNRKLHKTKTGHKHNICASQAQSMCL